MSHLEDRILKIVELKARGLDAQQIEKELELAQGMVDLYEKSVKKVIRNAKKSDGKRAGLKQQARALGLSEPAAALVLDYYIESMAKDNQETKHKKQPNKAEYRKIVQEAVRQGAKNVSELQEITGFAYTAFTSAPNYSTLKKRLFRNKVNYYREKTKEAIDNGASSKGEVAAMVGVSLPTLCRYIGNMHLPDKLELEKRLTSPEKRKRKSLIKKGLSIREISDEFNICRQAVDQYMINNNLKNEWKAAREKNKRKKREAKQKAQKKAVLLEEKAEKARFDKEFGTLKTDWEKEAYLRTTEYFRMKQSSIYRFDNIFKRLKKYYKAKSDGTKITLDDIVKGTNIPPGTMSKILIKVDDDYTARRKIREVTPKEKKDALKRAFYLDMNCADIAYFLEIPWYVAYQNMVSYFPGKKRKRVDCLKRSQRFKVLKYASASQIYEAVDREITKRGENMLIKKLEINQKLFDYALTNREAIEKNIMHALQVLYPNREITKPYINFKPADT